MNIVKKRSAVRAGGIVAICLALVSGLMIPTVSFANATERPYEMMQATSASPTPADRPVNIASTKTDCTATVEYYEAVGMDDPDIDIDHTGRRLMGVHTITGLAEGTVINAWDYVVDIPGYFFWDGFPRELTVGTNPDDNVIELDYMNLHNGVYTVNYYLMTGADLTANNWVDALAPDDVAFTKLGTEVFSGQRIDKVIEGDAYEYQLDDTYVIDTYPSEIIVGTDPDVNVINVLYTPSSAHLPSDFPIEERPEATPPVSDANPSLPDDTETDKDEIAGVLPNPGTPDGDEVINDFLGTDVPDGSLVITDEMLNNPTNKAQAKKISDAYRAGMAQGSTLSQTGDEAPVALAALIALAAFAVCALAWFMWRRGRNARS